MKRALIHILILLLVFAMGLALVGCVDKEPGEEAPPPPVQHVDTAVPGMSAGERAAARLQQSESGLMADGFLSGLSALPEDLES